MINLQLTEDQARKLAELLGAARGVFEELALEGVGLTYRMFAERDTECQQFLHILSTQFNEQVKAVR